MRTSEVEDWKKLPKPYEFLLKQDCRQAGALPFGGGLLDQPYLLLFCFSIIDEEYALWDMEKKKIEDRNESLRRNYDAKKV